MGSLDLFFLGLANRFVARSADSFYQALELSDRLSWILAACALVCIWFVKDRESLVPELRPLDNHRRVLLMFGAMASSFVGARILQHFVHRIRPMAEAPLRIPIDAETWGNIKAALSMQGAFPSDHAVMFAVVAVGAFSISRWGGILATLVGFYFSMLRVGLGFHWPSDIFVGALLGVAVTVTLLWLGKRFGFLLNPVVTAFDRRPAFAYPVAFLVIMDFSQKFSGLFTLLASIKGIANLVKH